MEPGQSGAVAEGGWTSAKNIRRGDGETDRKAKPCLRAVPRKRGLEILRRAHAVCPETKIIILTVREDRSHSRELLESGALGYLLKRAAADELIHAIRNVAAGKLHVALLDYLEILK